MNEPEEEMKYLENMKKEHKELNRMWNLAQTPQAKKALSNMIRQNMDNLFELIDKVNLRHSLDFDKPSWINTKRFQ